MDFLNIFGVFRDFWWFSLKKQNFQKMFDFQCLLNVFIQIFVLDRKYIIFYEYIGFFVFLVFTRPYCSSFRRYFFRSSCMSTMARGRATRTSNDEKLYICTLYDVLLPYICNIYNITLLYMIYIWFIYKQFFGF